MKILIVATSKKPSSFEEEIRKGLRYRLEYLELRDHFDVDASYMDYDSPWMHENDRLRRLEERIHLDFYWARRIARVVEEQKYDIVISMSERIGVPLGLLLPRRVKHIVILLNALSRRWLSLIGFSKVYRRWDKIVMTSHAEAEALKHTLKIEPDQMTIIHNCVDLGFFNASVAKSPGDSNGRFVMSQGLAKRDYPTLIRALWELPHVQCHISAVSAWDKHKAGYEGLRMPDNVCLKSYDHPFQIRNAMAGCEFLIVPLQPEVGMWCAGSTSVLQAQAMGKPIIVTRLPGTAEYVKDHETGFLVDGNNSRMLAEKIDFLWRNSDKAKIMGSNAQTWVSENFSLRSWIHKMAGMVTEL